MRMATDKSPNWCPHCHKGTLQQWGDSTPNRPVYLVPEEAEHRSYRIMGCLNPECKKAWLLPGIWWVTRHSELRSEWLE
jgi:hypothetical protein